MQLTKRKLLPIMFLILLLPMTMQITPVKAASWGVQEGAIFSYTFISVDDGAGSDVIAQTAYTQDGTTWPATTGDVWEWEISSLSSSELSGTFRTAGHAPNAGSDWVCRASVDNIQPTAVPVTPFFFIQDWALEGADFGWHGFGMGAEEYMYSYNHPAPIYWWSMVINFNHGYLLQFMFNGAPITSNVFLMFTDYTSPDLNPNYDPSTVVPTTPYTGTPTTSVPAGGFDLGAIIDGLFGSETIAGIPTGFFFLLLLLGIVILIMLLRRNKKRGSRGKKKSFWSKLQWTG